eukprot:3650959-Pyramimonas_sp.AAC.2
MLGRTDFCCVQRLVGTCSWGKTEPQCDPRLLQPQVVYEILRAALRPGVTQILNQGVRNSSNVTVIQLSQALRSDK